MQRIMVIGILLSSAVFTQAQDSLSIQKSVTDISSKPKSENNIKYVHFRKSMYKPWTKLTMETIQKPELTINEYTANELTSNWFVNIAGGASAFLGNPLGCEDLFGRACPMLHLSVGKWFSPSAGGRIAFQGFNLKNHLIEQQNYYHLHADFLWNVTNLFPKGKQEETPWQFIPYAGTGIIKNRATHQHPFTINYGFLNHIRLNNRLSLSLELGGLTTFGNFDGKGKSNRLSDHLFHLSVGINIILGNKGWKDQQNHVNDLLILNSCLSETNKQLEKKNKENNLIMIQMRKVLEIEGLLSGLQEQLAKSNLSLPCASTSINGQVYYPQNSYSGLNSLRERLSKIVQNPTDNKFQSTSNTVNLSSNDENLQWSTENNDTLAAFHDSIAYNLLSNIDENNLKNYITDMLKQKVCIGSPILFFFHIGTSSLTDSSQLANIDEIAKVCHKYNLLLKVTGYADSATGNAKDNSTLSNHRAHYIASELKKRNITEKSIKVEGKGGIDTYSPDKVNRCVKIEIYLNH